MKIVGGKFKGRRLAPPPKEGVRPSSERLREALFNICQMSVEGSLFLDLCAGTGAIGFEALSRGAKRVTMVEQDRRALRCIQQNQNQLGIEKELTLLRCDARRAIDQLKKRSATFDLIFVDPPYGKLDLKELLEEAAHLLASPGGTLFLETGEPIEENPTSLRLVSKRTIGPAYLYQFDAIKRTNERTT